MKMQTLFSSSLVTTTLFVLALSFLGASLKAHAEEVPAGSVYNEGQESEVVQRARRRAYPGGRDEGELAVQSQMTTPTRKINPQTETNQESHDD